MFGTPLSQSSALRVAGAAFGTIFIAFGVNAIVRPAHALTFFEFEYPTAVADRKLVDHLMVVYGARDIFMGVAAYIATRCGSHKALGWTLLAISGVAYVDGAVCRINGHGEWNHWGYAPVIAVVGILALGVLDRR